MDDQTEKDRKALESHLLASRWFFFAMWVGASLYRGFTTNVELPEDEVPSRGMVVFALFLIAVGFVYHKIAWWRFNKAHRH